MGLISLILAHLGLEIHQLFQTFTHELLVLQLFQKFAHLSINKISFSQVNDGLF